MLKSVSKTVNNKAIHIKVFLLASYLTLMHISTRFTQFWTRIYLYNIKIIAYAYLGPTPKQILFLLHFRQCDHFCRL